MEVSWLPLTQPLMLEIRDVDLGASKFTNCDQYLVFRCDLYYKNSSFLLQYQIRLKLSALRNIFSSFVLRYGFSKDSDRSWTLNFHRIHTFEFSQKHTKLHLLSAPFIFVFCNNHTLYLWLWTDARHVFILIPNSTYCFTFIGGKLASFLFQLSFSFILTF